MAVQKPEVLRAFLENERARLEVVIAQIESEGGSNLGYGNHMADDATDAYEQAKDLALKQNAEKVLIQIDDALERFAAGTYGACENCGDDIDPARLKALPYVTFCLRCQQRLDSK